MTYIKKGYLLHKRKCVICLEIFMGKKEQKLCSDSCRKEYYGFHRGKISQGLSTGTVGAIQELRVSVDLLLKGYEVFRAISPSCSCDLLAMKDKKMYRIEVRTGYKNFKGSIYYPTQNIRAEYLAIALKDKLIYKPELS